VGKHKNPRKHLSGSPEQWAAWAAACERASLPLNQWIQAVCDRAAKRAAAVRERASSKAAPPPDPRQTSLI